MKYAIIISCFILLSNSTAYGQNFEWAKAIENDNSGSAGNSICADASGSVYSTGFFQYTVDFDLGAGVYNLSGHPNGYPTAYVLKLDANGDFLWAQNLGDGYGTSIAVDALGNSYVASSNPYVTSLGLITKLDPFGNIVWTQTIPSDFYNPDIYSPKLVIDNNGEICVVSCFHILKINASGTILWDKTVGGNCLGISIDALNDIVVTGGFFGAADFDPGAANFTLNTSGSHDIFVCKLDASGNFVFAKSMGGAEDDWSYSVDTDVNGNIYTTGAFRGTADFDPGVSSYLLTSGGGDDIFVSKLSQNGDFIWTKSMVGNAADEGIGYSAHDNSYSIAVDAASNVYTTGSYDGNVDFDPSVNSLYLPYLGDRGIYISKLDGNGNHLWAKSMGTASFDINNVCLNRSGNSIYVDANGSIYNTGRYQGLMFDFNPYSGTSYYNGWVNWQNMYIVKFGPGCAINSNASQTNVNCNGENTGTATVLMSSNPDWYEYSWSPNSIVTSNSSQATGLAAGNYTCSVLDSTGCLSVQNFTITEPSTPLTDNGPIQTNNGCIGQANGTIQVNPTGGVSPYSFSWGPGTINGDGTSNVSDLVAGVYDCTITDANGCSFFEQFTITDPSGPPAPSICMVTVDENSVNNIIYWDKTSYTDIDTFIVYRETTANNYQRIGAVPYDSLSMFVDTVRALYFPFTGDPNTGTYRYKLQLQDNCGTYGPLSAYHNTIYTNQINGTFNWNHYEIGGEPTPISALSAYELFRDDSNTGNWNIVSAVAGTQTTITDPNFASFPNARWRIETIWSISCEPLKTVINNSRSNIKQPNPSAQLDLIDRSTISIYPNPTADIISVNLPCQLAFVELFNSQGQILQSMSIDNNGKLDLSSYESGIYFLTVSTENGNTSLIVTKK